jgi:hypothetical protein
MPLYQRTRSRCGCVFKLVLGQVAGPNAKMTRLVAHRVKRSLAPVEPGKGAGRDRAPQDSA